MSPRHLPLRFLGVRLLAAALLAALPAAPQAKSLAQGAHKMELILDKRVKNAWRTVDPGTIFDNGESVRFRFRTNFDGYLYVINHGTAGTHTQLFPTEDAGTENRVQAGQEYIVPATKGAFRVDGPAGYDVLYWMISPVRLTPAPQQKLPPPPRKPITLIPRCDDTILKARGECVDRSAGTQSHTLTERSLAPQQDLVFRRKPDGAVVSSPEPLTGPVTFEFRLAHK